MGSCCHSAGSRSSSSCSSPFSSIYNRDSLPVLHPPPPLVLVMLPLGQEGLCPAVLAALVLLLLLLPPLVPVLLG